MPPRAQNTPFRGTGPNPTVQGLQNFKPRHTPPVQNVSRLSSFSSQGYPDSPAHGNFSLSSQMPSSGHPVDSHVAQWINTTEQGVTDTHQDGLYHGYAQRSAAPFMFEGSSMPVTATADPLDFSNAGVEAMCMYGDLAANDYTGLNDFSGFQPTHNMEHQSQQFFGANLAMQDQSYPASVAPGYETPSTSPSSGYPSYPSPSEDHANLFDGDYSIREFENYAGGVVTYVTSEPQHPAPISPPLSEPSLNLSMTTSCPQWSTPFPSTATASPAVASPDNMHHAMIADLYPMDQPYLDSLQETTRSTKPHRPILSASTKADSQSGSGAYSSLAAQNVPQQRITDGAADRQNPAYHAEPASDGLYHCPWATKENCQHRPVKQKCNFQKYVDSHLRPFRCKYPDCSEQPFSSNACLLRHEREHHGSHGHGKNPYLCKFTGCERSMLENGFPRSWNCKDHMKRVHDYEDSEPDTTGLAGEQENAPKSKAAHKRKGHVTASGATEMKRTGSNRSRTHNMTVTKSQASHIGRYLNAKLRHTQLHAQLKEQFPQMDLQDPDSCRVMNMRLQELQVLAQEMRELETGQQTSVYTG